MDTIPQPVTPPPSMTVPPGADTGNKEGFNPRYLVISFLLVLLAGAGIIAALSLFTSKKATPSSVTSSTAGGSSSAMERKIFPTAKPTVAAGKSTVTVPDSPDQVDTGSMDAEMADLQKDLQSL